MCFGVAVDEPGSTDTLVARRIEEAEGFWWKWRPQLVASNVPLGERVTALQSTLGVFRLWGGGFGPQPPPLRDGRVG